jgi:AmmeMemoRadiSam system protein A
MRNPPGHESAGSTAVGPADFARVCVEAAVAGDRLPAAPATALFSLRAACFVSLKARGQLRGCIGTLEPAESDLGREVARNARSAAFHDPRFPPVGVGELDDLTYSVDVLSPSRVAKAEELDPRRYGVIVSRGWRRGVLLPDLPGVDTVDGQVCIALQKAGISLEEAYDLHCFSVTRYPEGDAIGVPSDSIACSEDGTGVLGPETPRDDPDRPLTEST